MRKELAFWLLICLFVSAVLGLASVAGASESTIVLMDNTTIKTVHHYERSTSLQSANWDDVAIINPTAEALCFDKVANFKNRADRYQQIDRCLNSATGVLA